MVLIVFSTAIIHLPLLLLGLVYNALDACAVLGIDAAALDTAWGKANKIKFGGGFYCGLVDSVPGKKPIYTFNGFFMEMRSKFVAPSVSIHYYVVEWDSGLFPLKIYKDKGLNGTQGIHSSYIAYLCFVFITDIKERKCCIVCCLSQLTSHGRISAEKFLVPRIPLRPPPIRCVARFWPSGKIWA